MSNIKIDKKELRKLFPITEKYVYLDHAGVAPVSIKALEAAEKFLKSASGHAGFHYNNWLEQVEEVRKDFAELIAS